LLLLCVSTVVGGTIPDGVASEVQRPAGRIVAWGRNVYGETNVPLGLTSVVAIASAGTGTYALRQDGTVVGWAGIRTPSDLTNIVAVADGLNWGYALQEDGIVVAWDHYGRLNTPTNWVGVKAIAGGFGLVLRTNGTVVGWSNDPFPGLSNVVAIAAGYQHALALIAGGRVMGWNTAVPADLTNVVAIAAGAYHSLALRNDGTVAAWGDNTYGQIVVPPNLSNVVAIAGGGTHSLALKRDTGVVVSWGNDAYAPLRPPPGLANVTAIAAGFAHSLALLCGPRIAYGPSNAVASLGDNLLFSVGVEAPGLVTLQWQFNGLNIPGATNATLMVTNAQPSDAGEYTVLVSSDGLTSRASAWLALSTPPTVLIPPADVFVFAGSEAAFAVLATNGSPLVYQWQLEGTDIAGATNAALILTNVQVSDAGLYSVRIATPWGLPTNVAAPLVVLPLQPMGIVVSWGSQTTVPAGLSGVIAISAGNLHTTVLRADGTVLAWGDNSYGQTSLPAGLRNVTAIAAGGRHNLALKNNGRVVGWGHDYNGQATPPAFSDFVAIAAGDSHSLGVRRDGTVLAWGNGYNGATTVPSTLSNAIAVAAGSYHSLALTHRGTVVGWGDNSNGQSSPPPDLSNVVAITAGHVQSLALRNDGSVFGFLNPVPAEATNVVSIAAQYWCGLAARADGTVVSWGPNVISPPAGLSNAVAVAAGQSHRVALVETGVFIIADPTNAVGLLGTNVLFQVRALGVSPMRYQWQFGGTNLVGATNASLMLANITRSDAGLYSVVITTPRGTAASETATLTVLSPPLVLAQPQSQVVLAGSTAILSVQATGTEPLRHQWQFNGTNLPGATSASLTLTNLGPAAAGDYRVRVSNAYGAVTSAVATVTVNLPPTLLAEPNSQRVLLGSNALFSVTASGTPPLAFHWRFNGEAFEAPNSPNLLLTNVQSISAGSYSVEVSNAFGGVTSAGATLEVMPLAPTIVTQPVAQAVLIGTNVTFVAAATGVPPLSYEWRFNGVELAGASNWSLTMTDVDGAAEGDYSVVARNSFGAATSAVARLTLRLRPNVIGWGMNTAGQTSIPEDLTNAIAIAAGSGHALALRRDGTVTAWGQAAAGETAVPLGLSNVVAVGAGNSYSLAVRTDGIVVGWGDNSLGRAIPPVGLSNVVNVTAGSFHSLALKSDGTVVGWGYNQYGQASPPPNLTNAIGLAAGVYHSVAVKRDGTIGDWGEYYGDTRRFSNIVAIAGKDFAFAALQKNGEILDWAYSYAGTNTVGPTNAIAIAVGNRSMNKPHHGLAVTQERKVVGWGDNSFGELVPPSDLSNVLAVAAGYGFSLALVRSPQITVQPRSHSRLVGSNVIFRAAAASELPVSFQWMFNGVALPGATNSNLLVSNLTLGNAGAYTVAISSAFGVVTSRAATLSVISWQPIITSQPLDQAVLTGEEFVSFEVQAMGAEPLRYQWRRNGTPLPNATNRICVIPEVRETDAGAYSVLVLNEFGLSASSNAVLRVLVPDLIIDNPSAAFTGDWSVDTTASARFGPDVRWKGPGTSNGVAQFTPILPRSGFYEVYEWHPLGSNYSTAVPHPVTCASGQSVVWVNQSEGAGRWNLLGSFPFAKGTAGSVRITDGFAEPDRIVAADAIKFIYLPSPPTILVQPQDQIFLVGSAVELSVTVAGGEPLSLQWDRNGTVISNATNNTVRFPAAAFADAGVYQVLVSNPDGTIFSLPATLTVTGPTLRTVLEGRRLRLAWPSGYRLQSATNVLGPYEDVLEAVSPREIEFVKPQEYFRLRE
jgi:alpha-tubulin suppressor-like RCC1 family protein